MPGRLISGILHLLRVPWRTPIIRMAEMITVISTMIGPAYILLMYRAARPLAELVLFGRIQSPIIWDVIAITTYLSGSIIFLYLAMIRDMALLRDNPVKTAKWRNPIYRFLVGQVQGYHQTKGVAEPGPPTCCQSSSSRWPSWFTPYWPGYSE